jgi:hypothetical protein
VLQVLKENDLSLKHEKCEFEQREVEYLGVISGDGKIRMDPVKVAGARMGHSQDRQGCPELPGVPQLLPPVHKGIWRPREAVDTVNLERHAMAMGNRERGLPTAN